MPYIPLSGKKGANMQTLVDKEDYATLVAMGKWHLSDTGYAVRRGWSSGVNKTTRMHRFVSNAPAKKVVDHLNGNKLDNRKTNLRICSQKENTQNRKFTKGYTWDKSKNSWMVRYRRKFYGRYNTEEEAKIAYKNACSGAPKENNVQPRRKFLPRGVFYMEPNAKRNKPPYYIRPQRSGIKYFQGYFATIKEAEDVYKKFILKED